MSIQNEIKRIKDNISTVYTIMEQATGEDMSEKSDDLPDALRAFVAQKQDKLTGKPGQVVGFGSDEKAKAVQGWSKPNLLDNPDFTINQSGFDSDEWKSGYGPDRWDVIGGGSLSYHDGVIGFNAANLCQRFEQGFLVPGTYTVSAFCTGNLTITLGSWSGNAAESVSKQSNNYGDGFASVTLTLTKTELNPNTLGFIYVQAMSGNSISYIKLELGSTQTLAHKEDDIWVLNDPPPDKALELVKCQRYFVREEMSIQIAPNSIQSVFFPTQMRIIPALTISDSSLVLDGNMIGNKHFSVYNPNSEPASFVYTADANI